MKTLECQSCSIKKIKPFLGNIDKPTNTIINKYEEFESLCKANEGKILKLFYIYRNNIQEILNESDKVIDIDNLKNNSKLSELFYLSLLLHNSSLVNFNYSFDFIAELDSINQKNENYITKIILSKIIIILIDYSRGLDCYNENQNKLEKIRIENIRTITEKLGIFNKEFKLKYDVKSFINKKIDDIYLEIIVSLFKKQKFNNKDYYENIVEKLDLQSIDITQTILDGLSEELDIKKNKFFENYMINEDRLEDEKVINFYNILFKIILKKPKYIYKNNFSIISRNNFNELIKTNSKNVNKFVIKQFISESYLTKDKDEPIISYEFNRPSESKIFRQCDVERKNDGDKKVNDTNSKTEISESKRANIIEINEAREILKKLKIIIDIDCKTFDKILVIKTLFKYGNNYQKTINYEDDLYNFIYGDKEGNNKDKDKEGNNNNKDKKLNDEDQKFYKKFKQFLNFLDEIKEYISKSKIRFNPRIILELKRIEFKSGDFDMKCISSFENKNLKKILKFTDNNILANGINGKNIGFTLLIQELSEDEYAGEEYVYNEDSQ